ncbi:MAG: HlyC/CorC family transporter, partial [Nanoarchaeota archaeon]|nr:HlyC/CorC family transporter [Nanoarchaeota archaeon]
EPHVIKLKPKAWKVLGKASIEEVNRTMRSRFTESPDYDTISGFVTDKIGRIPKQGEDIHIRKYTFKIEKMEDNRIIEIKITKK